jgi:transketolase
MKDAQQELINHIERISNDIRIDIVDLTYRAGKNGAHIGGSLSSVEILATLYKAFIKRDPADLKTRDRMIVSKAHGSLAHYCVLEKMGLLAREEISTFGQNGGGFTAHPKRNIEKGLEFSGGSLGLGLSFGVGVAYACKENNLSNHIYVLVGDGECNEGIVWEALMFAKHNKLNNLTVILDLNHLQEDGFIEDILDTALFVEKFKAFGLNTQHINGHSVSEIIDALENRDNDYPNAIVAETIKGKGVSFMENKYNYHFAGLTEKKHGKAIAELKEKRELS